jgi:hypothetical protein
MKLAKKHFLLAGILVIALAIIIALVGGKIRRDNGNNEKPPAVSNQVSGHADAGDSYWNDYDDTAMADDDSFGTSNSGANSITITGINGITGNTTISIYDDDGSWVAHGTNTFWGDTAEYSLYDSGPGFKRFTGRGSYIIGLTFESDGWRYYYTKGESLADIGVRSVDDISKLPKFTFTSAESTILFSQFKPLDYLGAGGK